MRPTLRRNGTHMVTVRSEHHLSGTDMLWMLGIEQWQSLSDFGEIEAPDITKAAAEDAIRSHLHYSGLRQLEFAHEAIGNDMDQVERAVRWAHRQISRHWPEIDLPEPEALLH